MSDRRQHRPVWYFHGLFITWRLWAVGAYTLKRKNWRFAVFAFGPLRLRFARLTTVKERGL